MQRSLWMRPALQTSEAVLMPALQRRRVGEAKFSDLYYHLPATENPFRPVVNEEMTTALSTYVRPRGSMGGRSVLRAAGVGLFPFMGGVRPMYYQKPLYGRTTVYNGSSSAARRRFFR